MRKLWKRFMSIFKAKANAALDELENPIEMYNQGIIEFTEKVKQSEQAVANLMAQVTIRKKELEQASLTSERKRDQAKQCVAQGREDLATEALTQKAEADKKVIEFTAMCNALEKQASDMRKDYERHKKRLKECQTKYDIFKAKYETAQVQKAIASSMSEIGGDKALDNLTRYEQQIEKASAEASAYDEIVNASGRLDNEIETITIDAEIVDEMENLRIEAAADKQRKEQARLEKQNKAMFGEQTKQVEAPKINPLTLLDSTPAPQKKIVFDEQPKQEDNSNKLKGFFGN